MTPDDRKLEELIVYIATKCEGDPSFGATKLNKMLFFSDFTAFAMRGDAITGHDYMRLENGPAPRRFLPIRNRLIDRGDCVLVERSHFGMKQKRLVATRPVRLRYLPEGPVGEIVESVTREGQRLVRIKWEGKDRPTLHNPKFLTTVTEGEEKENNS